MAVNNNSLAEFDFARKRLKQQGRARLQDQSQAIKRQFARTGMSGSGAAIKTLQKGQQQVGEQTQLGLEGIQAAELGEKRRMREIQEGRKFASGEAQKQRKFASGEAQKQREFVKGESALSRLFQKEQADVQRGFISGESQKGRQFQRALFDEQQKFEKVKLDESIKQFSKNLDIAKQKLALEKDAQEFNKMIAQAEMNKDTSLFGSMFGLSSDQSLLQKGLSIGSFGTFSSFCHLPGTMIVMADKTLKPIEDIKLGMKLYGGGTVNAIAEAYADDVIYHYKGELMTGHHVVLEKGKFLFVKDSKEATEMAYSKDAIVHPLNTDIGFYFTESGYASIAYMEVEEAFDPESEIEILNKNKKLIAQLNKLTDDLDNGSYTIRPLRVPDYNKIKEWFKLYDWAIIPLDQLPYNTTFVITDNHGDLIGMSSYYQTNSKLAVLGLTLKNPKKCYEDISQPMNMLYDYLLNHSREKGFDAIYYATENSSISMVKNMEKRGGRIKSNGDGYIMVIPLREGVNTDSLENKDYIREVI